MDYAVRVARQSWGIRDVLSPNTIERTLTSKWGHIGDNGEGDMGSFCVQVGPFSRIKVFGFWKTRLTISSRELWPIHTYHDSFICAIPHQYTPDLIHVYRDFFVCAMTQRCVPWPKCAMLWLGWMIQRTLFKSHESRLFARVLTLENSQDSFQE